MKRIQNNCQLYTLQLIGVYLFNIAIEYFCVIRVWSKQFCWCILHFVFVSLTDFKIHHKIWTPYGMQKIIQQLWMFTFSFETKKIKFFFSNESNGEWILNFGNYLKQKTLESFHLPYECPSNDWIKLSFPLITSLFVAYNRMLEWFFCNPYLYFDVAHGTVCHSNSFKWYA